jgi:hypothetical protein
MLSGSELETVNFLPDKNYGLNLTNLRLFMFFLAFF